MAAGCAHAPSPAGGAEMRARLLERADGAGTPARGEGVLTLQRQGRKAGSADVRWVSVGESLAMVASVGPVRVLQASLLGDSIVMDLRHEDLAVSGDLERAGFGDARVVRFLLEPWRLGGPATRDALLRGSVEPAEGGWRLRGRLAAGDPGGRLDLRLGSRGEPRALTLVLGRHTADTLHVIYGKPRGFAAGTLPRWVEWSWGGCRARLEVDVHAPVDPARVRLATRVEPGDTLLALSETRGRSLLRRLVGLARGESP